MFKNRVQAGQLLGEKIWKEIKEPGIKRLAAKGVVLGIPRGGLIVADQVAKVLGWPLDVIVVKKLGAPLNPELAIGAVGETRGAAYVDQRLASDLGVSKDQLEKQIAAIKKQIKKREELYRQAKKARDLKDKIVVIADDGAATGATMIAAAREVWNNNPQQVIIGLPVLSRDTLKKLEKEADKVIFLKIPWPFFSVGQFYQEFEQVSDGRVIKILS